MLLALGQPLAAFGLACALALGCWLRGLVQGWVPATRGGWESGFASSAGSPDGAVATAGSGFRNRFMEPLGVLAGLLGGVGFGPGYPGLARRPVRWTVLLGPGSVLAAGLGVLSLYKWIYPDGVALRACRPSDVLRGVIGPAGEQFLLALAVGLLGFGLLALVPVPPLDGYGLGWATMRPPGARAVWLRHWLLDRGLGAVLLVALSLPVLPGRSPIGWFLDLLATPILRLYA